LAGVLLGVDAFLRAACWDSSLITICVVAERSITSVMTAVMRKVEWSRGQNLKDKQKVPKDEQKNRQHTRRKR